MISEEKRELLIDVFLDTQNISKNIYAKDIAFSIDKTTISENNIILSNLAKKQSNQKIIILNKGSVETASLYAKERTAVLNFASAFRPGGGVTNGAMAQEETLCRCSFLYEILSSKKCIDLYYRKNQNERNYYGSDRIIYSPDIVFFKSDEKDIPSQIKSFKADVITCSAPNLRNKNYDINDLESVLCDRYKNIFVLAANNHVENLILGAIGCGVFLNPAEVVSNVMLKLCNEYPYFKNIVFPIYKSEKLLTVFKNSFY